MRSRASVKPSDYPALPFHGIRFVAVLSSIVVAIILAVFIYHLHADGYKLPFAFLLVRPSTHHSQPTTKNQKLTSLLQSTAPNNLPLHPPHNPPNQPLQLRLRPLHKTLPPPQHPAPHPLAALPRPPLLQHVRHHPNEMHSRVLGHIDRCDRLPHLQGSLRVHDPRGCQLYCGDLVGCCCAPETDKAGRV